jgi:glycosyltransferase involved in cell wall biosynthesis
LACGRPVIATDFQYARQVVNQRNGIVVPIGDEGLLSSAIKSVLLNSERRMQMASESYHLTRSWVWREVAKQHVELLGEVSRCHANRSCSS